MKAPKGKIRVRISVVVEVDPEAWEADYSPEGVEEDVREHLPAVLHDWLTQREVGRVVS